MIINHYGKRIYHTNFKSWWKRNVFKLKLVLILWIFVAIAFYWAYTETKPFSFSEFNSAVAINIQSQKFEELPNEVKETLDYYADLYGVNKQLVYKIVKCESNFETDRVGDSQAKFYSHGLWQFQSPTFYEYASKYKIQNADIKDYRHQTLIAVMMLRDGLAYKWTCNK